MRFKIKDYPTSLLILILFFSLLYQTCTYAQTDENLDEEIDFVYFYVNICAQCTEADELINNYISTINNANLSYKANFISYNISYGNGPEYDLYLAYLDYYDIAIDTVSTPILFFGDDYYFNEEGIKTGLHKILSSINENQLPRTPILDPYKNKSAKMKSTFDSFNGLKLFGIGFVNGLNPCSISMLLLLLSLFIVKTNKILSIGFTFILGKLTGFILLGTILYQSIRLFSSESYFLFTKILVSILILVLASLNFYDYFMCQKENYSKIKNQLPVTLRRFNHQLIKRFTTIKSIKLLYLGLFSLGILISAGEFLCTGQIYIVTITYMIDLGSDLSLLAILYLTIYSIGFIMPPAILLVVMSKTQEIFSVSEWIRNKMPIIKLVTAITLIILGIAYVIS